MGYSQLIAYQWWFGTQSLLKIRILIENLPIEIWDNEKQDHKVTTVCIFLQIIEQSASIELQTRIKFSLDCIENDPPTTNTMAFNVFE